MNTFLHLHNIYPNSNSPSNTTIHLNNIAKLEKSLTLRNQTIAAKHFENNKFLTMASASVTNNTAKAYPKNLPKCIYMKKKQNFKNGA